MKLLVKVFKVSPSGVHEGPGGYNPVPGLHKVKANLRGLVECREA